MLHASPEAERKKAFQGSGTEVLLAASLCIRVTVKGQTEVALYILIYSDWESSINNLTEATDFSMVQTPAAKLPAF